MVWHGMAQFGMAWQAWFYNSFTRKKQVKIKSVEWKSRFPNAGVDAKVALNAIDEIKNKNGGQVSPNAIVDAAKKKTHPLHKLFTWDDTEAAAKYRLQEAGNLLRSIEITYEELPEQPRRAFEIITKKTSGDPETKTLYGTAEEVAADPKAHSRLIAEAVTTLMAWRTRFRYLQELSHLIEEIDRTIEQLSQPS